MQDYERVAAVAMTEQALNDLNARFLVMQTQQQTLEATITQQQNVIQNLQQAQANAPQVGGGKGGGGLAGAVGVDTRVLGKPESFDGTDSRWRDWSTVVRAYVPLIDPLPSTTMEDAEISTSPVLRAVLNA